MAEGAVACVNSKSHIFWLLPWPTAMPPCLDVEKGPQPINSSSPSTVTAVLSCLPAQHSDAMGSFPGIFCSFWSVERWSKMMNAFAWGVLLAFNVRAPQNACSNSTLFWNPWAYWVIQSRCFMFSWANARPSVAWMEDRQKYLRLDVDSSAQNPKNADLPWVDRLW